MIVRKKERGKKEEKEKNTKIAKSNPRNQKKRNIPILTGCMVLNQRNPKRKNQLNHFVPWLREELGVNLFLSSD